MKESRFGTILSTLHQYGILAARPLRKKAVLFVILAISVLYCLISLAHIHLVNSARSKVFLKGSENNANTVLDTSDQNIPRPPNIISFSHGSSASHPSSHDEFAFLKRQHNLKESLEDAAKARHLSAGSNGRGHVGDLSGASTSDLFGGVSSGGIKCRNSLQGKHLIADDRGYVCPRKSVDINGCCATLAHLSSTKLYSCVSCLKNGCCAVYENCISCCLAPNNRELINRLVSEKKSPVIQIFIASITDYFELCLTKCRTSSASVQHENTYKNPMAKHCYSDNVGN